jgi:hypothetical protein
MSETKEIRIECSNTTSDGGQCGWFGDVNVKTRYSLDDPLRPLASPIYPERCPGCGHNIKEADTMAIVSLECPHEDDKSNWCFWKGDMWILESELMEGSFKRPCPWCEGALTEHNKVGHKPKEDKVEKITVTSEITIKERNGANIHGADSLFVKSHPSRTGTWVKLQVPMGDDPSVEVTVSAAALKSAIDNAVNAGGIV